MRVLKYAMDNKDKPYGPHLMGIVCHVLQDTFAHFGFSGITSDYNHVNQGSFEPLDESEESWSQVKSAIFTGMAAENTGLGHAATSTLPDMPWLAWSYEYEASPEKCPRQTEYTVSRRNMDHFLASAQFLHAQLRLFAANNPHVSGFSGGRDYSEIEPTLREAMRYQDAVTEDRCERWIRLMREGKFYDPANTEERKSIRYDESAWKPALENLVDPALSHAVRFNTAASQYLTFISDTLLPDLKLTF
jgi:hypothetical protein